MSLEKYKGVIPAFYACYEDNGDVSAERTANFAKYLLEKGTNTAIIIEIILITSCLFQRAIPPKIPTEDCV